MYAKWGQSQDSYDSSFNVQILYYHKHDYSLSFAWPPFDSVSKFVQVASYIANTNILM